MSTESDIENIIIAAKESNIEIVRGPIFIWSGNWTLRDGYLEEPVLKGCDAFGALLWYYKLAKPIYLKGINQKPCQEWKKVYQIFGKDAFWWHRFRFGWSQLRSLQLYTESEGKRKYIDDEVSLSGMKMYKKFVEKK